MILAASFEFFKKRNAEIVERHTDSEEVPSVSTLFVFLKAFCCVTILSNLFYQIRIHFDVCITAHQAAT